MHQSPPVRIRITAACLRRCTSARERFTGRTIKTWRSHPANFACLAVELSTLTRLLLLYWGARNEQTDDANLDGRSHGVRCIWCRGSGYGWETLRARSARRLVCVLGDGVHHCRGFPCAAEGHYGIHTLQRRRHAYQSRSDAEPERRSGAVCTRRDRDLHGHEPGPSRHRLLGHSHFYRWPKF